MTPYYCTCSCRPQRKELARQRLRLLSRRVRRGACQLGRVVRRGGADGALLPGTWFGVDPTHVADAEVVDVESSYDADEALEQGESGPPTPTPTPSSNVVEILVHTPCPGPPSQVDFEHQFELSRRGGPVNVTSLPAADPVRLLVAAVDALAVQVPADLPGPVALERERVLLAQLDRLRGLAVQGLGDVERRDLHELDGAATTSTWVAQLGVAGVDRHEVALARRLAAVPAVEAELRAGMLSVVAAGKVAGAVAKARPLLDRPDGLIDGLPGEQVLHGVIVDGICDRLAEQTGGAPASDPGHTALRAELEQVVASGGAQRARLEAGLLLFAQRSVPALLTSGLAMLLDALLPAEHDKRAAGRRGGGAGAAPQDRRVGLVRQRRPGRRVRRDAPHGHRGPAGRRPRRPG